MKTTAEVTIFSPDFPEPSTVDEAQRRLLGLRQDLNKIRQQLGDPERRIKMNLSPEDFARWMRKATHARDVKLVQQDQLYRWISTVRANRAVEALKTQEPTAILAELVDIVLELRQRHRLPLSADQQNILALAEHVVSTMETR